MKRFFLDWRTIMVVLILVVTILYTWVFFEFQEEYTPQQQPSQLSINLKSLNPLPPILRESQPTHPTSESS